jgi:hypothetical protein
MIDKPIYRELQEAVGEAYGPLACQLLLNKLAEVFESFARETEELYDEDPENDIISLGYIFAANWCENWAQEIGHENG